MDESYVFSPELTPSKPSSPKLSFSNINNNNKTTEIRNPIPSTSQLLPSPTETPTFKFNHTELIELAIESKDLKGLQELSAGKGGFKNSELRRKVWPILLGCGIIEKNGKLSEEVQQDNLELKVVVDNDDVIIEPHRDEGQVKLDVNRSFIHYPIDISSEKKEVLRERLEKVIVTILRQHPALRYFQGYHDIISVLLLTLEDDDLTVLVAEKMSLHRIRDSMGMGLEPVLGYLRLVHRILAKVDPNLSQLVTIAASLPYFSLSWVLTLMSHDLTSLDVVARLFDFLLANNPAMVSYLGVAIILLKKEDLLNLDEEDAEDPAIIHHTLSRLPDIRLSPPSPLLSPTLTEKENELEDEDLMSNNDDNYSLSTSHLSESVISLSTTTTTTGGEQDELDLTDSYSIFSDEMLSDPDVSGPAFSEFLPLSSPPASPKLTSSSEISSKPQSKIIYLEDLITKTLELWNLYPLTNTSPEANNEFGINAEEVLGTKSCIFTWDSSLNGIISDSDADEIARKGEDIILPEPPQLESEVLKESKEFEEEEIVTSSLDSNNKKNGRSRRRKTEIGIGAVLTVIGIAGVVLAIYGNELKQSSDWNFNLKDHLLGLKLNWSLIN